jgi:hypothetical protein
MHLTEGSLSPQSRFVAGLLLVLVPTIEFGGYSLILLNTVETAGYLDNPVRQNFFRAGHAHAGVLVILSLVALLYVDRATLSDGAKALVRWSLFAASLLMSGGFFGSMAPPSTTRPSGLIVLVYLGALSLAVGVVTLGIGLLRRGRASAS